MTLTNIPLEVLFDNPHYTSPHIAPNGGILAYLAPYNGVLNVWLQTPGQSDQRVITSDTGRGIRLFLWAEDSRHILFLQDKGGNENWRLYGVDIETGEEKDYTPFEEVQAQVLQRDKHQPDTLLLGLNLNNPQLHDVYRLTLSTGRLVKIEDNPGHVMGWVADSKLEIRAAVSAHVDGSMSLLYRESTQSEWETLRHWEMEDTLNSMPSHFSRDGRRLFLRDSQGVNTSRLVVLDLDSRKEKVLAEDPHYDIAEVMVDADTFEVQAVAFERAREEWEVIDPEIAEDFALLSAHHDADFGVLNRDHADQIWIVSYNFDDGPAAFYAYYRQAQCLVLLFYHNPELKDYTLAKMEPISLVSRDGLTLEGYITYPPGCERKNLPMVLNVHGGPWHRDSWGYHPEAQWLANRGYACLQINFRGSTGYGKAFLNAGDREWGGKMHADLIDAVEWAVAEAGIDRERIAIYGASYGGYAALVGATFTPEVFACAIDMVGPSSLLTLMKSFPPYWSTLLNNFKRRVGDPETEPDFLKSRSPLFKVASIQKPVLIAQGANDPRVTVQEAEQIVAAMTSKGIAHEYLLFEDEGHGLARPENRFTFYRAVEAFLKAYIA